MYNKLFTKIVDNTLWLDDDGSAVKHREQLTREATWKQDTESGEDWEGLTIG